MNYQAIAQRTRAYLCLDCGKCTGSCPLARVDPGFSPRRIVERILFGDAEAALADPNLWTCMTCGLCSLRCPSDVDFSRFLIEIRAEAFRTGQRGVYAHDGLLQQIMRLQAATGRTTAQHRTGWLDDTMQISKDGEVFYFVGCLPFFDVIFADLGVKPLDTARSAVRLLNRAGIAPIVSDEERCCGADLLLAGDVGSFQRLAERNVETIRASGARTVVFSCAECYNAFKTDYRAYLGSLPFEVMHVTELLAPKVESGELAFESQPGGQSTAAVSVVTYHDPCRMGRYLHVYEPPRVLLRAVPGLKLVEMEDNRERAMCCGSTAWVNCGGCLKAIQVEKLHQARETGAGILLTTCPKCQIHLACTARDQDPGQVVAVQDVLSWVGQALD
jgi:heterodisulfide reductase subunit D